MRVVPLVVLCLVAGCASVPPPACTHAERVELVQAAMSAGASPEGVAPTFCTANLDLVRAQWEEMACETEGAWRLGLGGADWPAYCDQANRWLHEAYNLGKEYARVTAALAGTELTNMERVRMTRERDAIRGVAQIKDWPLPESSRPDSPESP